MSVRGISAEMDLPHTLKSGGRVLMIANTMTSLINRELKVKLEPPQTLDFERFYQC